ncbi:putative Proteasome activator pa28 beta subunit [Blattamonas nauphoetae]|uniref:Proteasome activator pa28 beta subunit n=1 Tax=Blattamonas nauphoetae TaxID=2049346 RepID=A0ABQ9YHI9_9EUKA|nr:putative Proteasome activator pa28 beta subunit [Blattamonas nauphoetae]
MTNSIRTDVKIFDLIDPDQQEKSLRMIKFFAEKVLELDELATQYEPYRRADSSESKQVLLQTEQQFSTPKDTKAGRNEFIHKFDSLIREKLLEFIDHCSTFRFWFTLQRPTISDSNNFGLSVLETVIGMATNMENMASEGLARFGAYAEERGNLFVNFFQFPQFDDVKEAIVVLDQQELALDAISLFDIRNFYLFLHDTIVKNFDKIKSAPQLRKYAPDSL